MFDCAIELFPMLFAKFPVVMLFKLKLLPLDPLLKASLRLVDLLSIPVKRDVDCAGCALEEFEAFAPVAFPLSVCSSIALLFW